MRLAREGGLSPELRALVADGLRRRLRLDLGVATEAQIQDAFLFARNVAIQEGEPGYFEQFQGLYGLMRGLSVAAGLAFVAYVGWGLATLLQFHPRGVTPALIATTLGVTRSPSSSPSWLARSPGPHDRSRRRNVGMVRATGASS